MKKFTFGTPEQIVPSNFCKGFNYTETPVKYSPDNFKFKTTARGCVVEFPLKADEQVYGFGLQLKGFNHKNHKLQLRSNSDPVAYTNDSFTMENMLALPVLHNVLPRCSKYGDIDYMGKIWAIFDKYGLHNAEFVPYYENNIVTAQGNAFVSVYKGKKTIAVLCNLDDEKTQVEVYSEFKTMKELMTGETYGFENGKTTVDAPAVAFRIYELA